MSIKEEIELPESLAPFAELAAARLRGLHQRAAISIEGRRAWVEAEDEASVRAAAGTLLHLLYQERIYQDARPVRAALIAKLLET